MRLASSSSSSAASVTALPACVPRPPGAAPESGRLGQRGCLLGGLPDPVGARRVELGPRFRDETDVERPPDGEHERVAPAGELAAGLGDRGLGQPGAIVGEQQRANRLRSRAACRRGRPADAVTSRSPPDKAAAAGSNSRQPVRAALTRGMTTIWLLPRFRRYRCLPGR
jgi:hypothetical protein